MGTGREGLVTQARPLLGGRGMFAEPNSQVYTKPRSAGSKLETRGCSRCMGMVPNPALKHRGTLIFFPYYEDSGFSLELKMRSVLS